MWLSTLNFINFSTFLLLGTKIIKNQKFKETTIPKLKAQWQKYYYAQSLEINCANNPLFFILNWKNYWIYFLEGISEFLPLWCNITNKQLLIPLPSQHLKKGSGKKKKKFYFSFFIAKKNESNDRRIEYSPPKQPLGSNAKDKEQRNHHSRKR